MADFKDEISPDMAARLAAELTRAWPAFPTGQLTEGLPEALEPLALMQRVELLEQRLDRALPETFPAAAQVLGRALDSPTFTGWMTLPCGTFVARSGIDHPHIALPLLAGLTPRFSSEGPVRPFVERHPDLAYDYLRRWTSDPDAHVRRLASEGTRPRLPWARQLRALITDPTPNIELLERLVDDPSPYVRRSVANHLNDISKDHPAVALELARRWLLRGDRAAWVVRHGLRTLIKCGDAEALALLGVDTDADIRLTAFHVDPETVVIGDSVSFTLSLELLGPGEADAIIDYRVHYVGADGVRRPKVFKLTRRRLTAGRVVTITRKHDIKHVSIRRVRPGRHRIDVQVNGRVLGAAEFDVVDDTSSGAG